MTRSRTLLLVAAGLLVVALAACGSTAATSGAGSDVRTVKIDMADNVFKPNTVTVAKGETVRFAFTNTGTVAHDAFIGDQAAQAGHEMQMSKGDAGMSGGGHGTDGNAITVKPGDTSDLIYTFDATGSLQVGCHQPGHYAGGMKLAIDVT